MTDLASLRIIISGSVEDLKKSLEASTSAMFKFANRTQKIGRDLTRGLSLPLASVAGAAVKMSLDFNRAMANIGTLIPENAGRLNELKKTVQDLAVQTGKSTADVAGGLYEVLSAMSDTSDTAKILEINVKTASAGLATVNETVKFTTAVTKGYGDVTAEATQKVADLGAKAVEIGQTTFPELAASIGEVVPMSVALGVSQEELFAIMGTFSGVTGNASLVTTQLRSALSGLLDPSKELAGLYKQLGVSSGQALIEQQGLAGALQTVAASAEASGIPLPKMLGRVEAVTLALALSGNQADAYAQNLDKMKNAAGTVDRQFRAQTDGINKLGFSFDQLRAKIEVIGQDLGDALAPAVQGLLNDFIQPFIGKIREMATWFSKLSPETRKSAGEFTAYAAALGPVLYGTGLLVKTFANLWPLLKVIPAAFTTLATVTKALGVALLSLTKIVWSLVAAFAGLAIDAVIIAFGALASVVTGVLLPALAVVAGVLVGLVGPWVAVGLAVGALGVVLYKWGGDVLEIVQKVYAGVKTWMLDKLSAVWDGIKEKTAEVTGWFKEMYTAVVGGSFVPDMVDGIGQHFGRLQGNMVAPAKDATNSVIGAFKNLEAQIAQRMAAVVSTISTQFGQLRDKSLSALFSSGPTAAVDVAKQQFISMAAALKSALNPALAETEKQTKKTGKGLVLTGEDSDKAARKAERLADKVSDLGDKIAELAGLNNPTGALVKKIRDLLESGKTGNELASALEKIRDQYKGSERDLKKFERAIDTANEQIADQTKLTEDLDREIDRLTGRDRFPELTKQIQDAFSNRNRMSAEEFQKTIQYIGEEFATTSEKAQIFGETLQKIEQEQKSGFWNQFFGEGFGNMDPQALSSFTEQLGSSVANTLASSLADALSSGDVMAAVKDLGGKLGETLGGAVFGPFGAAIGGYLGDKIIKDITRIGESAKGTIKGISTAIDTIFPGVGSAFGAISNAIFGGSKDADTEARDAIVNWLNGQIDALKDAGRTLTIMGQNGEFFNLNSIMGMSGDSFEKPGWAAEWWQSMGQESASAFNAVGLGLSQMLGTTSDVGSQIAVILSENLGGNVDNLRLLIQSLNIDIGAVEDSLIAAGNSGAMSWAQVEAALNGLTAATGDGLVMIGNVEGAVEQLIATGGSGAQSIQSLQNIGLEAIESGAKSLEDLKARLRSSGKFTEQQITQIFQALADNGITSLDQLADVSDRTGGSIIADLENLGFKWGEVAESVRDTTDDVRDLDSAMDRLDGRDVDVNVNVHYNSDGDPPSENARGNIFGTNSPLTKFARGGIVSSPTMFGFGRGRLGLMGEAGPEAIVPLERRGGKLGFDFNGTKPQGGGETIVVHFNIDATGAEAGVEQNLEATLRRFEDRIVGRTVNTIIDRKRRGGSIGNILSR